MKNSCTIHYIFITANKATRFGTMQARLLRTEMLPLSPYQRQRAQRRSRGTLTLFRHLRLRPHLQSENLLIGITNVRLKDQKSHTHVLHEGTVLLNIVQSN